MPSFKYICGLLFFFALSNARAQNLVLNPGFESYTNTGGLYLEETVHSWYAYISTPDYFSTDIMGVSGVQNYCGTLPRSGNAMVGGYQLGFFPGIGYNREYIQGELSEPLKANTLYYAEAYVIPMRKSPVINFGIKTIGIAITDKHYKNIDSLDQFMIDEIPEVEHTDGPITAIDQWTKISACFMAKGGETKIILGNFRRDAASDSAQLPGAFGEEIYHSGMSYFLFDDIMVKEMPVAFISPNDTAICRDSAITLKAFPNNALSYVWSTGATSNNISISQGGNYTVNIITAEGCNLNASAQITTKYCGPGCAKLYMPNAFSPNNDGLNDYFKPMNTEDILAIDINIYNRFGERVYHTNKLKDKWDGHFRQQPSDVGTYFYRVTYNDCNGEEKVLNGDLVLVR